MQVYRDLNIVATAEQMSALAEAIEKSLPQDWSRNRLSARHFSRRPVFCFTCSERPGRPAADLFLADRNEREYFISNIVPTLRHQFTYAEYNTILADFYERVFKQTAEANGIEYALTDAEAELENWIDSATADLLRAFSATSNKGTRALHPNDRKKWNAFRHSAYQNGSRMEPATLERWLIEVQGWPPEIAEQLALEYESGLDLLKYVGSH